MLAAYHGHLELVTLLLESGADPNRLNDRLQSPLAGTIFKNETVISSLLLEKGADPDYGEPSARTAAKLFGKDQEWAEKFDSAPGKGKGPSWVGKGSSGIQLML